MTRISCCEYVREPVLPTTVSSPSTCDERRCITRVSGRGRDTEAQLIPTREWKRYLTKSRLVRIRQASLVVPKFCRTIQLVSASETAISCSSAFFSFFALINIARCFRPLSFIRLVLEKLNAISAKLLLLRVELKSGPRRAAGVVAD